MTHRSPDSSPDRLAHRRPDSALRAAEDQEVVREMAYVLRCWPGARSRRRGDANLAQITAERLVDYLHLSGFELVKRPMVTDTSYIGGGG